MHCVVFVVEKELKQYLSQHNATVITRLPSEKKLKLKIRHLWHAIA